MMRSEKVVPFVQTQGRLREVHDAITDMMKQLANEPSVGLYFVQQHVHKAVPAMVSMKAQMVDSTQEVEYVTQDVKDALNSVRSMNEVGPAVIERMIKTLDSSVPRLASLRSSRSLSSAQVPIEKSTSGGDYSGYVRTTFDSALQRASNFKNMTTWNSYHRGSKSESTSTGGGEDTLLNTTSEAQTESNPSPDRRNVVGTIYDGGSSLTTTASEFSTETGTSEEKPSTAKDSQDVHDFANSSLGKTPSFLAFREVSSYAKPGEYVRAVFGSARLTAENVGREATKLLTADGKRPVSAVDKPVEGWSWLQVPSKALNVFNKQPQTTEEWTVQKSSGEKVILHDNPTGSRSEEEIQGLLDMERATYEAFAAEKAAKLEEWLQDTGDDDKKTVELLEKWRTCADHARNDGVDCKKAQIYETLFKPAPDVRDKSCNQLVLLQWYAD